MGTPPLPVVGEQRSLHQTDLPDTSNKMTQNGLMMKGPLGEVFKVPEDNRKELESLNKSLNDYISMVQNLDSNWQGGIISRRTTVNVNVDRKTISVNIAIQEELQEIQKKCKKNDGEIAELLGKISLLEGQIREPRKPDLDGFELTNKHLEDEVCRLKCRLKFLEEEKRTFEELKKDLEQQIEELKEKVKNKVDELNEKRKENADVKSDVRQREKELRFQVSLKSREVTAERTKTKTKTMEEIKEKQVESYKIWMKKQLDELREMYEKQKVDVAATMRDMYVQKELKLTAEVEKAEKDKVVNKVDIKIKEELERLRMQLGELQTNNQQLAVRKTEIAAELDLKSNAYAEQLSAKEKELEKLRGDHAKIRAEIEEMMVGLNHEQVVKYSQALTPEMRRITDKARGRWGKEQMVNMSKVVNYSHKFSSTSVNSSVKASSSRKSETSSSGSRKAVLDESGIGLGVEDVVQEVLAKKSPSDKNKK